jgi:hypothetical protein
VRYVRVPLRAVIVIADDDLRRAVNRRFHWPMMVLALAVLPLIAWEFIAPPASGTWPWWLSASAMAVIWTAYVFEFIVKIAIAECRIEYCRRNWLDIVIIALPLLRPLRVAYLARTGRMFALRGAAMRLLRFTVTLLIGLEATDRIMRRLGLKRRAGEIDPAEMTRHQLEQEVRRLRDRVHAWESWRSEFEQHRPAGFGPAPPSAVPNTECDPTDRAGGSSHMRSD